MTPEVGKYYRTKNDSVVFIFAYELPCPFTGHQSKYPYRGCKLVLDQDGNQQSLRYQWSPSGQPAEHYQHNGLQLWEEILCIVDPLNFYQRIKPL